MDDTPLAMGPEQRAQLAQYGLVEYTVICQRPGCSYSRVKTVNLAERVIIGTKTSYGDRKNEYLMAPEFGGMGRLSRLDAYIALRDRLGQL